VDGRRAIDDDVVHDVWAAPATPPGDADESRTAPPGNDGLAPAERRPVHRTDGNGHGTAEEHDERRRIDGPNDDRTGRPPPVASDEDPAAVVVRRPSPRRRVQPGPAEARIPDPSPRAVGNPTRRDARRLPHGAVVVFRAP